MFNLTNDPKGVEAGSWINPKENVIKESTTTPATQQLYRVRKSKDDTKSQVGAYSIKQNAIDAYQKQAQVITYLIVITRLYTLTELQKFLMKTQKTKQLV